MEVQNIPAPRSSPTMSSGLPLEAAASEAKMSGHPLPKASKVTPCLVVLDISSFGLLHVSHYLITGT